MLTLNSIIILILGVPTGWQNTPDDYHYYYYYYDQLLYKLRLRKAEAKTNLQADLGVKDCNVLSSPALHPKLGYTGSGCQRNLSGQNFFLPTFCRLDLEYIAMISDTPCPVCHGWAWLCLEHLLPIYCKQ